METNMTEQELEKAIANQPFEKITKDSIESRIDNISYMMVPDTTIMLCHIRMQNGYTVSGESACVDPGNFNLEIGKEIAYRNAFTKLWPLEGYLLAEKRYLDSLSDPA